MPFGQRGDDVGGAHRAGDLQQAAQLRALRIGIVLVTGATALVGLADDGQLRDAFGLAEAVATREQVGLGSVAMV